MPFFSGEFDDPNYDDVNDPTAQAGITCTVCHAITNVNSPIGNAAYTIEEPQHYPFAFSDSPYLAVDQQPAGQGQAGVAQEDVPEAAPQDGRVLLDLPQGQPAGRAEPLQGLPPRPEPLRHVPSQRRGARRAELLLPAEGEERELRVVPHAARSRARDFGSKDFDGTGTRKLHNHLFPGANTGLFALLKYEDRLQGARTETPEGDRLTTGRGSDGRTRSSASTCSA